MITKTIWTLIKPDADDTDAVFLTGLDCKIELHIPEPMEFSTLNGTQVRYTVESPTIEITTTCEKQVSMLKLKYGDALHLKSTFHTKIFPYEN
jgi:hypothetical protein